MRKASELASKQMPKSAGNLNLDLLTEFPQALVYGFDPEISLEPAYQNIFSAEYMLLGKPTHLKDLSYCLK